LTCGRGESGGPFEFGAHQFSEAELAELDAAERERALGGLRRLRGLYPSTPL